MVNNDTKNLKHLDSVFSVSSSTSLLLLFVPFKTTDCSVLEIQRFKFETGLILINARKVNITL